MWDVDVDVDVDVVWAVGCGHVGCGVVVSHISEDLYNLAWSSGPPVVGIEDERYSAHSLQQTVDRF